MLTLGVEMVGVKPFRRSWDKLTAFYGDLRPVWKEVTEWFHYHVGSQFASEGSHLLGSKWKPLTAKYKEWKDKYYGPLPILTRSGKLRNAVTGQSGDAWKKETKGSLTLGIRDIPYWRSHLMGYKSIPRRAYMALSKDMMRDLDARMQKMLNAVSRSVTGDAI